MLTDHIWRCLAGLCVVSLWVVPAVRAAEVQVEIRGVTGEMLHNVQASLSIERETGSTSSASGQQSAAVDSGADQFEQTIRRLHRLAPAQIRQALQPFGYYHASVDASLKQQGADWVASYRIKRGPPTLIRQVDIRVNGPGGDLPAVRSVLKSFHIVAGQRLDHGRYKDARKRLLDTLYNQGYLDAHYKRSEIRVDLDTRSADIALVADSGLRFYFGSIDIQQDILDPVFVARMVPFRSGDPFRPRKLLDLQLALESGDYFSQVEVQPRRDEARDHRIPVQVTTEPRKPRRYSFGLGFGTDTGPRVSVGTELRRINRRGHQFRSDLTLSTINQTLSAQYTIPIENVTTDRLTFSARTTDEAIGDFSTRQFLLGANRSDSWGAFRRQLYLSLMHEKYDLENSPGRRADLLFPGITLSRQQVDDPLFPRRGYSLTMDLHGGVDGLGSDTSFVRATGALRTVSPLGEHGRLLLRVDYGATGAGDFVRLPPSERFFAGGDRSVRGYTYQALGPRDANGNVIGGEYLLVGSVEVDYLAWGNLGAAAFFDAGNAADNPLPELKRGVGIGLRYRSPVGMVRVDLAHPLDSDDNFRLHISLGSDL